MKLFREMFTLGCLIVAIGSLGWITSRSSVPPPIVLHELGSHAEPPRSGKWPKVRADHLALHPDCEVCGRHGTPKTPMQVHHVLDFHENPDRELDPTNLITLCGPEGCGAHLFIGHVGNYQLVNKHVREDAAILKGHYEEARR